MPSFRNKTPLRFWILGMALMICFNEPAGALMALPDIGIDFQTMTVRQPQKLKAAGMKDVQTGDKVTMTVTKQGAMMFINQRTAETLTYPAGKP
jgi:hypothetical protein